MSFAGKFDIIGLFCEFDDFVEVFAATTEVEKGIKAAFDKIGLFYGGLCLIWIIPEVRLRHDLIVIVKLLLQRLNVKDTF